MTPRRLWTLRGLSVELDRDRRAIAKALGGVRADGLGKHRAWHLSTALKALDQHEPERRRAVVLQVMLMRAEDWSKVHRKGEEGPEWSINEVATVFRVPVETVLTWARAGAPYVREGCWRTGAGFVFRPHWLLDWRALTGFLLHVTEDQEAAARLGIPLGD